MRWPAKLGIGLTIAVGMVVVPALPAEADTPEECDGIIDLLGVCVSIPILDPDPEPSSPAPQPSTPSLPVPQPSKPSVRPPAPVPAPAPITPPSSPTVESPTSPAPSWRQGEDIPAVVVPTPHEAPESVASGPLFVNVPPRPTEFIGHQRPLVQPEKLPPIFAALGVVGVLCFTCISLSCFYVYRMGRTR